MLGRCSRPAAVGFRCVLLHECMSCMGEDRLKAKGALASNASAMGEGRGPCLTIGL